jgi:uncharacterized membrane protein YphA (DoxX/SURF4 family)
MSRIMASLGSLPSRHGRGRLPMTFVLVVLRLILAAVFAISAVAKLADCGGFRSSLGRFGIPEGLRSFVAALIPILELSITVGLLHAISAWFAAVGALCLLVVFTLVIVANLVQVYCGNPNCYINGSKLATVGQQNLAHFVQSGGMTLNPHGVGYLVLNNCNEVQWTPPSNQLPGLVGTSSGCGGDLINGLTGWSGDGQL